MTKTLSSSLLITLAALAAAASARTPASGPNEAAAARHYAALIAGDKPKTAELVLFFSQMPKGGDLHHHYSGAIYAETYVDWLDKQGACVNKITYRIETEKNVVDSERAKQAKDRTCLSSADVYADDAVWRELLQRWSSKDFNNHGAIQPPPDRQFFQTFGYFGPVSDHSFHEGLLELKNRALAENVSYIETMFKSPDTVSDPEFDKRAWDSARDDAKFAQLLEAARQKLDATPTFKASVDTFVKTVDDASQGIDDENFTMRYQTYVVRLFSPSRVFSSMLAAFEAAARGGKIVGVNIVGQESQMVSMRDYTLHMQMFRFLKKAYPKVNVAMHAGELALGDVPPEDLKYHIDQALNVAGAQRIGHGIDLAHETNAVGIMKTMKAKDIPVEINLTSNAFIEGVQGENHPITLYRKYGVPYVISTDDAGVTRHNLANEYVLFASRYKPTYAEIKKASYNGIRYSFLPEADKARLTHQLDVRYARFEANIAALDRTTVKH
ncbi:adenosine deaminase [Massilia sp. TW-1]|uniref:adenosine deaminase n=1 Tax=Telluria antibiotica TaxID=2717319 RepID=A0ABX0PFR8_9BURK|nr:adenosine deaminase [Telluria antibiotica]NIA55439.1 adenosine deaminase [Telluria antibiotica]